MDVTSAVEATCFFGTISPLAFGTYNGDLPLDANTTIEATCTTGTAYVMTFGDGLNDTGTLRQMAGSTPASFLTYHLYAAPSQSGEIGLSPANTITGTGTGASVPVAAYGRIDADQALVIGTYGDTVAMTIEVAP